MSAELDQLRGLLVQALSRLDALQRQACGGSAQDRRDAALVAAADHLDPSHRLTGWGRALRLSDSLRSFDRSGLLRQGRRSPRDVLEAHLLAAHQAGIGVPESARQLYRIVTSASDEAV